MFNAPDGGLLWYDLRKILPGCQQTASVPNGVETLSKISIALVGRTNVTERRQTDGRTMTYSERSLTRSSSTAKSIARPSYFVGVLYDNYRENRETNNRSTATKLAMRATEFRKIIQNNGHYNVQGRSRSPILVPIKSPYTTSY